MCILVSARLQATAAPDAAGADDRDVGRIVFVHSWSLMFLHHAASAVIARSAPRRSNPLTFAARWIASLRSQ